MIQIPVSVFAKYLRNRRIAGLKQTKYAEKKENQIPFKYYRSALSAITRYHRNGNDPAVFKKAQSDLAKKLAACQKPGGVVIIQNNLRAIFQYQTYFGRRQFEIRPVPKLKFPVSNILVSAKVDMHVIEGGEQLLLKLDMCKGKLNESEARSLLAITGYAAKQNGLPIPASNVHLLRLEDGSELQGNKINASLLTDIQAAANEIEQAWNDL